MDWIAGTLGPIFTTFVGELRHLVSPEWWSTHAVPLFKILMIDLTLAGDNAIVVGMAASRVNLDIRARVIFWGIAGAVILRILFSSVAQQMLQYIGLTLAGGLLLLFVCWKMYRQIAEDQAASIDHVEAQLKNAPASGHEATFWSALWTIILADLSMSLDNVLAVAGAAGESKLVLIIGLGIAIILMAIASTYIARLLGRYPWIAWIGLIIILFVALDMIYRDSHLIACATYGIGCKETIWQNVLHQLGMGGG